MITSIEELETTILERKYEDANTKLLEILTNLDANRGFVNGLRMKFPPPNVDAFELESHVAVRLANSVSQLFSQPDFHLSEIGLFQFLSCQRWIASIYAATPLRNADHVIRAIGGVGPDGIHLDLAHPDIFKLCVLYTLDSELSLRCDELWAHSPRVCASLLMALLSPRMTVSVVGHRKRETILQWLPSHLDQMTTAADLQTSYIHDVWMHCSYSLLKDKHAIKASLNRLIRRQLEDLGLKDVPTEYKPYDAGGEKPVLLVVLEWFHASHSVYRVLYKSLAALKERFKLVGFGDKEATDETSRALFDEFIGVDRNDGAVSHVGKLAKAAEELRPQIIYYLGVGMFPHVIYAANLRLAPIQCVGLGHAATTMSPTIDYYLLEKDFVGDPDCYSEKIVSLPIGSMPFVLPNNIPQYVAQQKALVSDSAVIAVSASSMKLNPEFLSACKQAQQLSRRKLEFRFFSGFATGLNFHVAKHELEKQVPGCVVYPFADYATYLVQIQNCDMFVNPFPYGNMNSIVDTVIMGLDGVCLDGPEPHEAIDAALFRRLGLPQLHVVGSRADYPKNIAKYAEIAYQRRKVKTLDLSVIEPLVKVSGPSFADMIFKLQQSHLAIQRSGAKVVVAEELLASPTDLPESAVKKGKTGSTRSSRTPRK
ncbi:MAG: hypothetical protein V4731_16540 [Pseudomonadota bacterium]